MARRDEKTPLAPLIREYTGGMSERYLPSNPLDRPDPNEPLEILANKNIFDDVRLIQRALDLQRFDNRQEAYDVARRYVVKFDAEAREQGIISRVSTLIGEDVVTPTPYYDDLGGVSVKLERAYADPSRLSEVTGPFEGFSGYGLQDTEGRYRPVLAFQVQLRKLQSPNLYAYLLAYGQVDTTWVDFLDDELKQL